MKRKHTLIIGPARSGTSFLVAYYGMLGFDLGMYGGQLNAQIDQINKTYAHGGLEILRSRAVRAKGLDRAEVIKHPWVYNAKQEAWQDIDRQGLKFKYIVLTKRDPKAIAMSLATMMLKRGKIAQKHHARIANNAKSPQYKLDKLEEWAANQNSEIIRIEFPRIVKDFDYLWDTIEPSLRDRGVERETAKKKWENLRNGSFVRH
jgi:hypothetical protein